MTCMSLASCATSAMSLAMSASRTSIASAVSGPKCHRPRRPLKNVWMVFAHRKPQMVEPRVTDCLRRIWGNSTYNEYGLDCDLAVKSDNKVSVAYGCEKELFTRNTDAMSPSTQGTPLATRSLTLSSNTWAFMAADRLEAPEF